MDAVPKKIIGWNHISEDQKRQFARNLTHRRSAYSLWRTSKHIMFVKTVLIVGDRPGPGAKDFTEAHHNTPFYSKTYCSGWMNACLVLADVPEERLMWINSAAFDGTPTSTDLFKTHEFDAVIALGNNASKWLTKANVPHEKFDHPQYHKRFKNSEPYPLIERLAVLTRTQVLD
jgi:hypothetical protein